MQWLQSFGSDTSPRSVPGIDKFIFFFFFCPKDVISVLLELAFLDAIQSVRTRLLSVEFGGKELSED